MTINLHLPSQLETLKPRITVIGVGGAGGNAVNNMIASNLEGIDFVIANTDAQALENALTDRVIQLGISVTRGLGAGAKPDVGLAAAEEAIEDIIDHIQGSNMVFITAGMGGGTGTGGAPVVARIAKEHGMLTVGVVTKPFQFEGAHRMRLAEAGIRELQQYVDTLIVIPNQNLFRIANEKTTFAEAFRLADEVLHSGVRGVTDLIVKPGLVNLDFADIRAVMAEMGKAMMGTGEATGDQRALQAAEAAISNPLLDDVSLKGAHAVLVNITGGQDMTLYEVDEAVNRIRDEVDADANIIFGSTFSDAMEGKMRVSVVATGIEAAEMKQQRASSGELVVAAQLPAAPRKTFGSVAATSSRPATPQRERTPAEIVRQAGTTSVQEAVRQATVSRPAAERVAERAVAPQLSGGLPPTIRIIDEAVRDQEEQRVAAQQQAAAAQVASEQARAVAPVRPAATEASPLGPLFVSPRAEQPGQRTLFTNTAPKFVEDEEVVEEAASSGKNIFGRLANVGKAIAGGRAEAAARPAREPAVAPRKAEVKESAPHAADEEELYDIPAFLRRQAN